MNPSPEHKENAEMKRAEGLGRLLRRCVINHSNGCLEYKGALSKWGYGIIGVFGKRYMTHRFVFESHNGEIPKGMMICHKCDNPKCVNIHHLFMGTCKDNVQDCVRKGRWIKAKGERHGLSKLTPEKVLDIRRRYKNGETTYALGKEFSVDPTNITSICRRKTWTHI